jgi:hypothetical protein
MISGPAHPLTRDGIWHLLRERTDLFERGLRIVVEDLDFTGASGVGDGLARDAAGAPVLVFVAADGDHTLLPRVLTGHAFVVRNGAALARALPEAEVRFSTQVRVFVIGPEFSQATVEALQRLGIDDLEILVVETFRLGGQERFVVRSQIPGRQPRRADGALPTAVGPTFDALADLLQKIDPAIRVDGDRFSRRFHVHGRLLCDFWCSEDRILAALPGTTVRCLEDGADVRRFGDAVMRRYLDILAERDSSVPSRSADPGVTPTQPAGSEVGRGSMLEHLRVNLAAARLSREEYSALGATVTEGSTPATG